MTLEFWMLYTLTVFLASIIPGPSMLLALSHGMRFGARRTVATALGNVCASLIQAGISIAGLGALLTVSEGFFLVVKWLGAAYLIYVGGMTWRSPRSKVDGRPHENIPQTSLAKMFLQAFLVAAGNPKAIVFFTALFPQFIDPATSHLLQFLVMLVTLAAVAFGCFMLYAVGGERIINIFSGEQIGRYLNRVIGGTFIGAGIGLVLSRR